MLSRRGDDGQSSPVATRRADGLGGFGVALHPFSKGGKRDHAERSI